jgi:hypothetical protein
MPISGIEYNKIQQVNLARPGVGGVVIASGDRTARSS